MRSAKKSKTIRQVGDARVRVFLSCSSRNAPFVAQVSKYLKLHFGSIESSAFPNNNSPTMRPPQETHGDFAAHVERQISNCNVFVSFFGSVIDDQQAREITHAVRADQVSGSKRRFIVCLLDGFPPPPCLEYEDFVQLQNCPRLTSKSSLGEAERVAAKIKKYIGASMTSGENHEALEVVRDQSMSAAPPDRSRSDPAMTSNKDYAMFSTRDSAMRSTSFDHSFQNPKDKIESTIQQADALVKQSDFDQARRIVRGLAGRLCIPGLSDLIQDVLQQIDEAERKHKAITSAEASIGEAQRFVNQGDFENARKVIDGLPNQLTDLKREIIRQVDAAAEQWRQSCLENERIIARLNSLGLDTTQVIGEFAARNNLDSKNQLALNAILKTIVQQLPQLASDSAAEPLITSTTSPPQEVCVTERSTSASAPLSQEKTISRVITPTEFFPHASVDSVDFSITSPPAFLPGSSCMIDVWVHLAAQREEVLTLARTEAGSDSIAIRSEGPFEVTRGTILTVRLCIQDLVVEPSAKCILWQGGIGKAGFFVSAPKNLARGSRKGVAAILIDGVPLVKIFFVVEIGDGSAEARNLPIQAKRYRKAFISYASSDKDAVLARVQGLKKGVPNLDVFWPPADIESGARWQDTLAQEILSRDVMYLFWSVAASQSRWVDWEWRYAYKKRGISFIDPCPLAPPEVAPPPRELADHLHFNDWALAYMAHGGANVTRPGAISRASQAIKGVMSAVFSRRNWGR